MACMCDICMYSAEAKKHFDKLAGPELTFFKDMLDELYETKMDLNYKEVILSGDWPHSIQILERALQNAKQKHMNAIRAEAKENE